MSCQQNSSAAAGAGARNGVPGTASKVAYAVGAAAATGAGAGIGGVMGGGIGSVLGPAGTVAGAAAGAAIGGRTGYKAVRNARDAMREFRQNAAEEKAWKDSRAGGKAIKTRTTQRQRAKENYTDAMTGIKTKKDATTKRYQAAKEEWMRANTGLNAALKGGVRGAVGAPEAKVAAVGVAQGAVNVIGRVAMGGDGQRASRSAGQDLGKKVGAEAYQQMKQYKTRVEKAKQKAWLDSPEGKVANGRYEKAMNRFRAQEEQHTARYNQARASANRRYNTARSRFSEQYKACTQAG